MPFPPVGRRDVGAMEWTRLNQGRPNAVEIKQINRDPVSGAILWLVHEPAGFQGSGQGNPHYLPVDEEALFLEGTMVGDPDTTYVAGDYLFFPRGFLHSPDDGTTTGATIVMRLSGPMSYVTVPLAPGQRWTRADERQMIPGQLNSRRPISRLATGDLAWEDLRLDGRPTGERVKLLSTDRTSDACTFLWAVPPGWAAAAGRRSSAVTREWLVLEGEYTTGGDDTARLGPLDYRCLAPGSAFGGEGEGSPAGCIALCWSDGPLDHVRPDGSTIPVGLG